MTDFPPAETSNNKEPHSNKRDHQCNTNLEKTWWSIGTPDKIITSDVEVQTIHSVLPHYLFPNEEAHVITNKATQTTITCGPEKSESRIITVLKLFINHERKGSD